MGKPGTLGSVNPGSLELATDNTSPAAFEEKVIM